MLALMLRLSLYDDLATPAGSTDASSLLLWFRDGLCLTLVCKYLVLVECMLTLADVAGFGDRALLD